MAYTKETYDSIQSLVAALEAGSYRAFEGRPLKVESLESTMRIVTFLDLPTRKVDGRRQPVLNIYGKFYEFMRVGATWVQAPAMVTAKNPTVEYCLRKHRISVKRLTQHQLKKANKKLNHYLEFLLREET